MSRLSYVLIVIMVTALIYMGAVRGYQVYQRKVVQWEEERQNDGNAFSFQNVPVALSAPMPDPTPRPVSYQNYQEDFFLEDTPLTQEGEIQQAKDTLTSILADYQQDPHLQAFNKDLAAATGGQAIDLTSLSGESLPAIVQKNPQIREIVGKHMKDPDFSKVIQQIFSNPQFVKSVQKLQEKGDAQPVSNPEAKKNE